jgi:hypothetical protein
MEIWKPVIDAEGYEISSLGNVRSIDRAKMMPNRFGGMNLRRFKGKPIKTHKFPNGYIGVMLGRGRCRLVHRLLSAAFVDGDTTMQVNHKNGVRDDNRFENLEWVSCGDNHRHSYKSLQRKTHAWTNRVEVDGMVFQSQNAAARHLGVHGASVASALIHGHKVCGKTVRLINEESNHATRNT